MLVVRGDMKEPRRYLQAVDVIFGAVLLEHESIGPVIINVRVVAIADLRSDT